MRIADQWKDYEILDTSGGEKLERWGGVTLIRPDPQIIWHTPKDHPAWRRANARYQRSSTGAADGRTVLWKRMRGPSGMAG